MSGSRVRAEHTLPTPLTNEHQGQTVYKKNLPPSQEDSSVHSTGLQGPALLQIPTALCVGRGLGGKAPTQLVRGPERHSPAGWPQETA